MTDDLRRSVHMLCLRDALMARRYATRAQLAADTGLSTMTVGKLLAELEARGEVTQEGTLPGAGGRPSTVAAYNGAYAHVAVVSVEQCEAGSAFSFGVYDLLGERVALWSRTLTDVRADSFDIWMRDAQVKGYCLRLVVFALPGEAEGDNVFLCDFEGLLCDGFLSGIRERFGVETLFENDVNTAVFGHDFGGDASGVYAGIYFARRYGPGAGLVAGGEILHGKRNFAGEVAFIHGFSAWQGQEGAELAGVLERAVDLLTIYACVAAPAGMVIYGECLTQQIAGELSRRVALRLEGKFHLALSCQTSMAEDMQRGGVRLALRRMRELLGQADVIWRTGERTPEWNKRR